MASIIDVIKSKMLPGELVERYTSIIFKRKGTKQWTCCPLHGENTPSMMMDNHGHLHCFGCGWHGDELDLIAALDGNSLVETVKQVASDMGIQKNLSLKEYRAYKRQAEKRQQERAMRQQDAVERREQIKKLLAEFRFLGQWLDGGKDMTDENIWTVVRRRNEIELELMELDEEGVKQSGNRFTGISSSKSSA